MNDRELLARGIKYLETKPPGTGLHNKIDLYVLKNYLIYGKLDTKDYDQTIDMLKNFFERRTK